MPCLKSEVFPFIDRDGISVVNGEWGIVGSAIGACQSEQ